MSLGEGASPRPAIYLESKLTSFKDDSDIRKDEPYIEMAEQSENMEEVVNVFNQTNRLCMCEFNNTSPLVDPSLLAPSSSSNSLSQKEVNELEAIISEFASDPTCSSISQSGVRSSVSNDGNKRMINGDVPNYEISVLENSHLKYEMVGKTLFAQRLNEIWMKVKGAQTGNKVKIQMKYDCLALENTPIYTCRKHCGNTLKSPCCISKLPLTEQSMDEGHIIQEICVPNHPTEEEYFTFRLLFWCNNSCHKNKPQKLILTLYDQSKVLKETCIGLHVSEQVRRDIDLWKSKEGNLKHSGKKRSGEETEGPVLKKSKLAVEERGKMQAGEATTAKKPSPNHDEGTLVQLQLKLKVARVSTFKVHGNGIRGKLQWIPEAIEADEAETDPHSILFLNATPC